MVPRTRPRITLGIVLFIVVLVLGALARTHLVTQADLHTDIDISHLRSGALTLVVEGLNGSASPVAGILVLVAVAVILVVMRRRWDALRAVGVAGAAWVTALALKVIVGRPRPPSSLWVIRPDHSGSFPSGTTTTAVVLFLLVLMLAWRSETSRKVVMVAGVAFALAIGFGRLYLGDHYPTDVLGSYLTVTATTIFTLAVLDTAWARELGARWLHAPEAALPAPAPYGSHARHPHAQGSPRYRPAAARAPEAAAGARQPEARTEAWPHPDHAATHPYRPMPADPYPPAPADRPARDEADDPWSYWPRRQDESGRRER